MLRNFLLVGSVAALVAGGVAIAQTAPQMDQTAPPDVVAPAAPPPSTMAPSSPDRSTAQTPNAGAYGADTAQTSGAVNDQATQMAGERG